MSDKTADELILNNAPEGATHFDAGHCYWDLRRCNDYHKVYSEDGIQDFGWFETDENPDVIGLRSLADIKALIAKDKRIAELEKKLFTQENEANKAVLRACNMLVEKDDLITELEEYNLSLANESCEQQKRIAELESLIKECDKYLDINKYTAIGNMSILHREMKQILNKGGDL